MDTLSDERVLVLMPTARDGERTVRVLADAALDCLLCRDIAHICHEIERGAGAALIAEEVIEGDRSGKLRDALKAQPPWSDFPLVVLARVAAADAPIREMMNATLIERPLKIRSLLSVVRAALRSRRRQYEVRNYLQERKGVEDRLRESEQRFRLMADAVPVLIWVSDLSKGCTWFNKSWLDFAGRPMHELLGNGWSDDVHPDDLGRCVDLYNANFNERQPFTMEYRMKRHDGEYRWFENNGIPRFNGEGAFVGYIGSCVDFTDRKGAEEGLRQLADDLSNADRKKDDFIALLAHELRNPLAPIRNGLNIMRLSGADQKMVAESREIMERQLTHMVRLIDDLLDVSRINRNKMELRLAKVTLAEAVSSALETARPVIDAEGHNLTVTIPNRPIYLEADLTRLAQVFGNLLTNSAKYTRRGGRIWLTAEQRDGEVAISVRDNGIGIPATSLSNIFDMFSQVNRSVERTTGGLGIGLALVKGLVEMHGGTVAAASDGEGKGSTFTVALPVAASPAPPASALKVNGQPEVRRRILVVDDSRDGANSLALMLRLMGNEVRTAHDGLEGVEAASEFQPEIVLMDVGMPLLNGLDATKRIRAQEWGRNMTIIALTGWGQEGDKERSREAGCDGHLVKPVDFDDLQRLLSADQRPAR